jgi:hypothetical protein
VTLDPDVAALLRQRMKEGGLSFKAALNQAVREGLLKPAPRRYRLKTFRMGCRAELRPDKAPALAAALEEDEIVRKLILRK